MTEKMYLCCCGATGRAVILGRSPTEPIAGQPIRLTDARQVLYWGGSSGLLGLAANGPGEGSRITAAVASHGDECVRQWVEVSDAAAVRVDSWPAC